MPSSDDPSGAPTDYTPARAPSPRRRRWLRWLREAVVTLAIAGAVMWGIKAWRTRSLLAPGTPLPALHVEDLEGHRVTLPRPGEALLLHLWAPW